MNGASLRLPITAAIRHVWLTRTCQVTTKFAAKWALLRVIGCLFNLKIKIYE